MKPDRNHAAPKARKLYLSGSEINRPVPALEAMPLSWVSWGWCMRFALPCASVFSFTPQVSV